MAAWLKALLFLAGGVTAAAGAAYVTGMLDPWLGRPPATVAVVPETPADPEPRPEQPAAAEDVPTPDDPQTSGKQSRLAAPSFDIVRVEPDGSVLVAGKAAPEAKVELMADDKVLAGSDADAAGDFVIVLDEPLAAGDYVLSLRASAAGGEPAMSDETAIVSIPEAQSDQVLVMVEEPGAPAELLTVPDAPAAHEEAAAAAPEEEDPAGADGAEPAGQETVADGSEDAAGEQQVAAAPATAGEEQQAATAPDTPDAEAQEAAGGDAADTPAPEAAEQQKPEQETAAAPAAPEQDAAQDGVAASHGVVVEAVEIEGDRIFVAGKSEPGLTVRVYADEVLLGDALVSPAGRFLVEARRELPVGNYVIRADLLGTDGAVLARAAVPFEREPGETIAAVAVPPQQDEQAPAAGQPAASEPAPEEAPAGQQVAASEPVVADEPSGDQPAAAAPQPAPEAAGEETAAPAGVGQDAAAAPEGQPQSEIAAAPAPAGDEPGVTAPKLQRVDGSVIIRRGDTLWRISRRVYGHGIRYSTIYLANQDQIRDPDLIWPGQVFSVPQQTQEGEEADMGAIAGQVVTPEQESSASQ